MRLTYIFHSGFVLETEKSILIFDYWMDPGNVMESILQSIKPLYVLSSHFHEDHFTREIFEWRKQKENITYILSKDIFKHRRASKEEADAWLAKGASWSDELVSVKALGSTDSGVSWIVETEGKRIFHAGDLNNWYARFLPEAVPGQTIYSEEFEEDIDPIAHEKQYLGELKDIRKELLEDIKSKGKMVHKKCYCFIEKEDKMACFYNAEGILVSSRPATREELRQPTIFAVQRKAANE